MAKAMVLVGDWGCAGEPWDCEEVGPVPAFKPMVFLVKLGHPHPNMCL